MKLTHEEIKALVQPDIDAILAKATKEQLVDRLLVELTERIRSEIRYEALKENFDEIVAMIKEMT